MVEPGYTESVNTLIARLAELPGLGRRSAERVAFALLKQPAEQALALADAITRMKRNAGQCSVCRNVTESDPCPICADPERDRGQVLVVEQPADVISLESARAFGGVYHVLMGRLAPLDGLGPEELDTTALLERVRRGNPAPERDERVPVREVILGLSPTVEGDGTALYLREQLEPHGVAVTRLGRGLPAGSQLGGLSKAVLADALAGRETT